MIVNILYRFLWFLSVLALQVLVFDHIHAMGIAVAIITPWFVMMMPQGTGRVQPMLWGFALGMASDVFASTPGLSAAAMTFVGLVQPPLLSSMTPKDSIEGFTPSYSTLGRWPYVQYVLILLLCHHLLYFVLECMTLSHLVDSAMRAGGSLLLSFVVILCLERLRSNP